MSSLTDQLFFKKMQNDAICSNNVHEKSNKIANEKFVNRMFTATD